jgi:hypothetical protein
LVATGRKSIVQPGRSARRKRWPQMERYECGMRARETCFTFRFAAMGMSILLYSVQMGFPCLR